jgi:outer membrane protein assembly factor BamB/tetratricopeptide (TPR) repeat protein
MRGMRRTLLAALLLAVAAAAQESNGVGSSFWISTPSGAGAALQAASSAIATRDWARAAQAVQTVLERYAYNFVALPGGRYAGARRRALELIAALPEEGRREYERLHGAAGETALRRALSAGGRRELLDVVLRYEATEAGLSALLALADGALARGRPAEARLALARVPRAHPLAASDPAFRARRALAAARDHAEGGPPPSPEERAEIPAASPALRGASWPMLGGNAARNRIAEEPSYGDFAGSLRVTIPERRQDRPAAPSNQFSFAGGRVRASGDGFDDSWVAYAPVQPVVDRARLVFHDGQDLFVHNLYTRDLLWRREGDRRIGIEGRTNVSTIFSPVVADGIVYASLEAYVPFERQELQGTPITYFIPMRRLAAFDIETGEPIWRHDDATLASMKGGELLRKLTLSGVPLVRGDRLYVGGSYSEGTIHNFLVAVDRHTGELAFATRISNGQQELNLFGRQLHECVPTPVAEADGLLYYGTNLGVVAAVDALLGTPAWATSYPIEPLPTTYLWFEAPRRWPRLDNGPPVVAGELLLVAPADGQAVLALDRFTGEVRWELPVRAQGLRTTIRTLYGADDERAYLGGEGVVAIWLRDDPARGRRGGAPAWGPVELPDLETPAGRALVAEEHLWVPTPNRIVRVERRTGRVAEPVYPRSDDANGLPAHVLWADGALVLAGRDSITVRFARDDVRARAERRAESSDPEVVLEAGELFLAATRLDESVAAFTRAARLAERAGRAVAAAQARRGLHRALLRRAEALLMVDPEGGLRDLEEAIRVAPDAGARLRARLLLEEHLEGRESETAVGRRMALLEEIAREHGDLVRETDGRPMRGWAMVRLARIHVARRDPARAVETLQRLLEDGASPEDAREAAREIDRILRTEGSAPYERFERRAERLFADAFTRGDLAAVERGLALYPNAAASGGATIELARRRLAAGEAGDAVRALQRFASERPHDPRMPEALLLMCEALHARGSHGAAHGALRRLRARYPDARVPGLDGKPAPARAVVEAWLARPPYSALTARARTRALQPPLAQRFVQSFPPDAFVDVPEVLGLRPPGMEETVFLRAGHTVSALDGRTGRPLYTLPFPDDPPRTPLVLAGGNLLLLTERAVHVFEAATGRAVAVHPFEGDARGVRLLEQEGQVFVVFRPEGGASELGIAALHAGDGAILWSRVLYTSESARSSDPLVLAAGQRVVVVGTAPVRVTLLDSTTGAEEGRVTLRDDGNASLEEARLLPSGRLLVAVLAFEESPEAQPWTQTYELFLLDPDEPVHRAVVWSYRQGGEGRARNVRAVHVVGEHVVLLDEDRGATALDLSTGAVVTPRTRLDLDPSMLAAASTLAEPQPSHDSWLLVMTRPQNRREPTRLAAFDVPAFRRQVMVEVAESGDEQAIALDAHGALAVWLYTADRRNPRHKLLLFSATDLRAIQRIELPEPDSRWIVPRIQAGMLVVTAGQHRVYVFGPQ